jgi:hypothetical protein
VTCCFYLINPFHLCTIGAWGWKIAEQSWDGYVHQQVAEGLMTDGEASEALDPPDYEYILAPKEAVLATRLDQNLMALRKLLSANQPPEVLIRALKICNIIYGFGDAFGKGISPRRVASGDIPWSSNIIMPTRLQAGLNVGVYVLTYLHAGRNKQGCGK